MCQGDGSVSVVVDVSLAVSVVGVLLVVVAFTNVFVVCFVDSSVNAGEFDIKVIGTIVEVIKAVINIQLRISALELIILLSTVSTNINKLPITTWCSANVVNRVY